MSLFSWERSTLAAVGESKSVYGHEAEALAQGVRVRMGFSSPEARTFQF